MIVQMRFASVHISFLAFSRSCTGQSYVEGWMLRISLYTG